MGWLGKYKKYKKYNNIINYIRYYSCVKIQIMIYFNYLLKGGTMIVIEGPDGSGKSTLARVIKGMFPQYTITHSPGPCPEEVFKERNFWNLELCNIKNVIVDRISVISESIYGKALRDVSHIKEEDIRNFLGRFYQNKENLMIYCSGRFKEIKKETGALYMSRDEKIKFEDTVSENLKDIRVHYKDFFEYWMKIFQGVNFIEVKSFEDYIKLFEKLRVIEHECK